MLPENAAHAAAAGGCAWLRPWRVLLIGLAAVVAGSALSVYDGPVATPVRLLLMVAGLIAGGWAVKQRLTTAGEELDERVESAGLVAVYSFAGLVGYLGMADTWFSGRNFFGFFIAATAIGSVLALLPRVWRYGLGSLLVLLHFGGIVVATQCIPATNGQVAWLPLTLNARVYRPYLSSLYLTNAYHFYAPDPGASTLVWLRIEYADHSHRWLKLPDRPDSATPLHYQREMGISEITSTPSFKPITPKEFEYKLTRRRMAGQFFRGGEIPLLEDRMPTTQYSAPGELSQEIMSSMVRHVCRFYPSPTNPASPPVAVKVYRLTYTIIMPEPLLQGHDPTADDLKLPYYMGEFDTQGRRKRYGVDGKPLEADKADQGEDDPFLYWAIPMNCLPLHAGDLQEEGQP